MDDNQPTMPPDGLNDPSPQEVHERLENYLRETENLLSWLKDGLTKGEEQLRALKAFDDKVAEMNVGIAPLDTAPLETEMESIRKYVLSLDELHGRIKNDIAKVEGISAKIAKILEQYQGGM